MLTKLLYPESGRCRLSTLNDGELARLGNSLPYFGCLGSRPWDQCPFKSARPNLATIKAQALWKKAWEGVGVTTAVFANHDYVVLKP